MKGGQRILWAHVAVLCALLVTTQGGCQFPSSWTGRWFQLGVDKHNIFVNTTHIEGKGSCIDSEGDKYLLKDSSSKGYICIVMYEKHANVLQYKETLSYEAKPVSLSTVCNQITGDAPLISMFRLNATPVPCPFKSPPFSFFYSRGYQDCAQPLSRADFCTDDTRLIFRYQACADIAGTEATVEELECLATWKDGSSRYLVGRLHHKLATTDEEMYRCFNYQKLEGHVYQIAQSGEASCNGLTSPQEGSRTMVLTKIESQHSRCKFPSWVVQHNHWRSIDNRHNYRFLHRNASLRVSSSSGDIETKLFCHTVDSENQHTARLVVHSVSGCTSSYQCMTIYKRDSHVIQIHQSGSSMEPSEACLPSNADSNSITPPVTLITSKLPGSPCPLEGRYVPLSQGSKIQGFTEAVQECRQQSSLQSLSVGCDASQDTMEFQSNCRNVPTTAYSCHGSWKENSTTYVIGSPVSRRSTEAHHYCFIFSQIGSGVMLQRVAETCALSARPVEWTFNITSIGKCSERNYASGQKYFLLPPLILVALVLCTFHSLR